MNPPQPPHPMAEWHPPSPQSTPQSAKFANYHFLSPTSSEPSPSFGNVWMTPQGYAYSSGFPTPSMSTTPQNDGPPSASSLKRPRPISYQNIDATGQIQQYTLVPPPPPPSVQASFPSHSFIEQFHGTHIGDGGMSGPTSAQRSQVHTPPPTRKTSARKKNQPTLVIPVETPPTIIARRSSDHETWLKRTGQTSANLEAAPLNYPPLHIPPPPTMSLSSGPLTAPVYPHSQLFWDPNAPPDISHITLSTPVEGPFVDSSQYAQIPYGYQGSLVTPPSSAPAHNFVVPPLPKHLPPRPHSARPAEADYPSVPQSHVLHVRQPSTLDPSMLVTAQLADGESLIRPSSVASNTSIGDRQPYQYQLEALQREKEGRLRKPVRRPTTLEAPAIGSAASDLRRTLTENRAKKAVSLPQTNQPLPAKGSSVSFAPVTEQIIRTGSPLKRQKSSLQQQSSVSPLKNITSKSVVLTIDEKGHASTEVKAVDEQPLRTKNSNASLALSAESDSESDAPLDTSPSTRRSSSALDFKRPSAKTSPTAGNDAQEALKEIMKARRQGIKGSLDSNPAVDKHVPVVPAPHFPVFQTYPQVDTALPTTMNYADLQKPVFDRDGQFYTTTRCICNNSIGDEGQFMIQCESCFKWQHVDCLGFGRDQIPPHFFCVYCTGINPVMQPSNRFRAHVTPTAPAYYAAPLQSHGFI